MGNPNGGRDPRVWFVSELYYPEMTSTGGIITQIAERLADDFSVHVVCAQPNYSARGVRAPKRERYHGVGILRCGATTFDKNYLGVRLINILTFSLSAFCSVVRHIRRDDTVIVLTNPPLLPVAVSVACSLRRVRCVLLVHDVYPEALVAAGMMRTRRVPARLLARVTARLYQRMTRIVVLGTDMQHLVKAKNPNIAGRIRVIGNFAEAQAVFPLGKEDNPFLRDLGLVDKFVVQYAGNMGRTHGLEDLIDAASKLRDESSVHFLFAGWGAKRAWLENEVRRLGLDNVTILAHQPAALRNDLLNACDVGMMAFVPGMTGVSVPSRTYNVLASGTPMIVMADEGSELARLITTERLGWVVAPRDTGGFCAAVLEARGNPAELARMASRARRLAEEIFTLDAVVEEYREVLRELVAPRATP